MKFLPTAIPEVVLIEPRVFTDTRGFFLETWRADTFAAGGIAHAFVQDNLSRSCQGSLRGLHYQIQQPQGKLVRVISGEVFDVAVDMRKNSASFGRWVGTHLSAGNQHALWIPPGFAHGYYVISESAEFAYKCTDYYAPQYERTVRWDDPAIGIAWPLLQDTTPLVSDKDANGASFADADYFS